MRRPLTFILLLIAIGLTTTICIAWFGASIMRGRLAPDWIGTRTYSQGAFPTRGWRVEQMEDRFLTARLLNAGAPVRNLPITPGSAAPRSSAIWTEMGDAHTVIIEHEAGWPRRALRTRARASARPIFEDDLRAGIHIGGLDLRPPPPPATPPVPRQAPGFFPGVPPIAPAPAAPAPLIPIDAPEMLYLRALPLMPMWPGLLLNTLLFSAAWGTLLVLPSLPGLLIRWRRRRTKRCQRCGYRPGVESLELCPECGHKLGTRCHFLKRAHFICAIVILIPLTLAPPIFAFERIAHAPRTPELHRAALRGDLSAVRAAIAKGATTNDRAQPPWISPVPLPSGLTPLELAAARGHAHLLPELSIGLRPLGPVRVSAMVIAIENNQPESVRTLIDAGVGPLDGRYLPVITNAYAAGHLPTIGMLREALPPERDFPFHVLDAAVRVSSPDLPNLLDRQDWTPTERNTALVSACAFSDAESVRALLERGADPNTDVGPLHPLCHAAAAGDVDSISLLLDAGADPDCSCAGKSVPDFAPRSARPDITRLINQARPNTPGD